jgi:acyl-CoA synthetase (AMP-forming)/AMP-acid ligase II/acyl carrier protein
MEEVMADQASELNVVQRQDAAADALLALVQRLALELHPHRQGIVSATLDSSLEREFGFDSLGRVELLQRLEHTFGVQLPEQLLATAETPRDLLRALAAATVASRSVHASIAQTAPLSEVEAAPVRAGTLIDVLAWHTQSHPQRPHLYLYTEDDTVAEISYAALHAGAAAVAAGLQERGLRRGQTVAIMLPTSLDFFHSFYGILLAGGIPVPIYPPTRLSQLEDHFRRQASILENARVSILVTVPEAQRLARLLSAQVEGLHSVVTVRELSGGGEVYGKPPLQPDDVAFLQYTSGSTGTPKGVILTHANLLANIRAMGQVAHTTSKEVFVSWLPLYHDMGLIGACLGSLYYACPLVLMSPLAFLARPQRWLWAIHRHRATLSPAPNFAYALCVRKVMDAEMEGLDLSAWRHALCGAEQVSPEVIRRFCQRFAKWGFRPEALIPVYGLAEATLGVTFCRHGPLKTRTIDAVQALHTGDVRPGNRELASVGVPISGVEVQIREDAGRALPPERLGRIFVRGPSVMKGYFNDQEATSATLIDGWLDTGDVGFIADGELFIYGRSKEIIIIRGANRTPQEFEECLEGISGLRPGCAVAAGFWPEGAEQEELLLLAERSRRGDAPPDAVVIERIRVEVTRRTGVRPHTVALLDPGTLPKTTSGKWRRGEALKRYLTGTLHPPRRPGRFELVAEAVRSRLAHARLWFSA